MGARSEKGIGGVKGLTRRREIGKGETETE